MIVGRQQAHKGHCIRNNPCIRHLLEQVNSFIELAMHPAAHNHRAVRHHISRPQASEQIESPVHPPTFGVQINQSSAQVIVQLNPHRTHENLDPQAEPPVPKLRASRDDRRESFLIGQHPDMRLQHPVKNAERLPCAAILRIACDHRVPRVKILAFHPLEKVGSGVDVPGLGIARDHRDPGDIVPNGHPLKQLPRSG
uniref:Uncharacterized protein n=1 Tax=Arundo donax TaxID=35708 RepID=A0A0A9HDX3_ARUDO